MISDYINILYSNILMILAMVSINIVGLFMINDLLPNLRNIFLYGSIGISIIILLLGYCLVYNISKLVIRSQRSTLKSKKINFQNIIYLYICIYIGISDQTTYDKMLEKSLIISEEDREA